MQVEGDYAYCVFGPGLAIIDVSNPDSVHFVSQLYFNFPNIDPYIYPYEGKVVIYGSVVFMSLESDTIYIVDIQDPHSPSFLGHQKTNTGVLDMRASDGLLFVAEGDTGIEVYDISDAASGSINYVTTWDSPGSALKLQIRDTILFLADGDSGFHVADISDVCNPEILGSLLLPYSVYSLAVRDTIALVSSGDILFVLDISDFSSIEVTDSMYEDCHLHFAQSIIVNGNTAYLSGMDTWIVDITDPTNIRVIGEIWPEANAITLYSDVIYRATVYDRDLMIYDVQDPDSIILLGELEDYGYNGRVFFKDDYGILQRRGSDEEGLLFYDLSSPQDPSYSHRYLRPGFSLSSVHLWEDLLFSFYSRHFFEIIDVSSVMSPRSLFCDSATALDWPRHFWVEDSTLYLCDWYRGHIVDFTDPANPENLATIDLSQDDPTQYAFALCVVNSYLYASVNAPRHNLLIYDITDEANPVLVSDFTTEVHVEKMECNDPYLYLADYGGKMEILDISDPEDPLLAGVYESEYIRCDMILRGNLLYVCSGAGVEVLSIDDPVNPVQLATCPVSGSYLAVDSDYVYVSNPSAVVVMEHTRVGVEEQRPMAEPSFLKIAPNPCRGRATIEYRIPRKASVTLKIYDMAGRLIEMLVNEPKGPGYHRLNWDARGLASGVYFAEFATSDCRSTKKLTILR